MHEIERGELRAPAWVIDIDIGDCGGDGPDLSVDVERYATAWCLVRRDGRVIAARFLDIEQEILISTETLRAWFARSLLDQALEPPPRHRGTLTVIIPTNRKTEVQRALASLARQSDKDFDVLVVDNSPDGDIAGSLPELSGLNIRCCHEPIAGVTHARNRGLQEIHTELVAWIDDDEIADPDWIAWIRRGFGHPAQPDAVAGVMLPAELETEAQANFERYGGFNKGRPMGPVVLRAGTPAVIDPLYPLPNFGAGGNMAFRTEALRSIGAFKAPLGTPGLAGDETWVFALILDSGGMILHWPPAVTWHYHRRTHTELREQLFTYSAGLSGFYTAIVLASPRYWGRVARIAPDGARQLLSNRRSSASARPPDDFPEELLKAVRDGIVHGPFIYLRKLWRDRRRGARQAR